MPSFLRLPLHGLVLVLTSAIFLGACTSSTSEATSRTLESATVSPSVIDACRATAVGACGRVDACGANGFGEVFGATADCVAIVAQTCVSRYLGPGATSAPAICDASRITCGDVGALLDIGYVLVETPSERLLARCPVTPGAFPDGASCLASGDCASGACVRTSTSSSCGRCAAPVGEGSACRASTDCAAGLGCDATDGRFRCARARTTGEACDASAPEPCAWGDCIDGTCHERLALGASCDEVGPRCDRRHLLTCAPDRTCQPYFLDPSRPCKVHGFDYPDAATNACAWRLESPSPVPAPPRRCTITD